MNQKLITVKLAPVFALVFAGILVYALLLNGDELAYEGKFFWGPSEFINYYGSSDAGSYLRLALDLSSFHVSPENIWILNLWPPGMSVLDAIAIALPGSIFLWMILINVCLTALPVALVLSMAKTKVEFAWLISLSAAFVFQPNKSWVLTEGLFMSDGVGSHLLLIGLLFGLQGFNGFRSGYSQERVGKYFILSGISFALSLHFRFGFFPTVGVLVTFSLILMASLIFKSLLQKRFQVLLTPISLFLVSIFLTATPWTLFVSTVLHPGNPSWSTGDYQWSQRWMTDEHLLEGNAGWLVSGEANWACDIEPDLCQELQKRVTSGDAKYFNYLREMAIQAAIANPLELFINKADPIAEATWTTSGTPLNGDATIFQIVGTGVIAGLLVVSMLVFVRGNYVAWLVVMLIFSYLATLVIAHVESRYMIPFWDLLVLGLLPNLVLASGAYPKIKEPLE